MIISVESVSYTHLALLVGDVLATGYWAARISEITEEDTVLIIGAGPTGIDVYKRQRNYRIEIQFHTQESFDVKMSEEDHKLYEQRRVLELGCEEYNRILQLQLKLYSDMEYPENIADLEKI